MHLDKYTNFLKTALILLRYCINDSLAVFKDLKQYNFSERSVLRITNLSSKFGVSQLFPTGPNSKYLRFCGSYMHSVTTTQFHCCSTKGATENM